MCGLTGTAGTLGGGLNTGLGQTSLGLGANKTGTGLTLGGGLGMAAGAGLSTGGQLGTTVGLAGASTGVGMGVSNQVTSLGTDAAAAAQQQAQLQLQLATLHNSPFGDSPLFKTAVQVSFRSEYRFKDFSFCVSLSRSCLIFSLSGHLVVLCFH